MYGHSNLWQLHSTSYLTHSNKL